MTRKVLVTGAGGYIGRHVVKSLLAQGSTVLALTPHDNELPSGVTIIGDDFSAVNAKTLADQLDSCIHLAWKDGFKHDADSHLANLHQHYAFLTELVDGGLSSLTVLGTMHEVGYWEGAISEDTPCQPRSLYGVAKNALRQALLARLQGSDVAFRWLRAFYILGDDGRSQSLFSKILGWEKEGKETFPFTSGTNAYDFISVETLATQVVAADAQSRVLGIINCCSGEPEALRDRVMRFIKDHDLGIRPKYGAFPDRPYDSPGVWGDPTKIRRILESLES